MRILLASIHFGYLRNYESVIAALVDRGHEVLLAAEEPDVFGGDAIAQTWAARSSRVTIHSVPDVSGVASVDLGLRVRLTHDYLRYCGASFADYPKLSQRLRERVPKFVGIAGLESRRWASPLLETIDGGLPVCGPLTTWLEDLRPEVVLLTSLTHIRSCAPEILRAAIHASIPSVACVQSWDHLSSKARIVDIPDRTFVWNRVQLEEAVTLHALPADRVVITGAQCYDRWFDRKPSRNRSAFCSDLGLDPARPVILYVCSALTPSPNEPQFVLEWLRRLRASTDPRLRDAGVIIRPHPERVSEWDGVDVTALPGVVLRGRSGDADASGEEYFDTLFHAAAVVGVVTSSFLEAAIVGRPVLTVSLPEFAPHQTGMRHFRYLLDVDGGLLTVASSLGEHERQLAEALISPAGWHDRQAQFIAGFVRAGHLERAATPRFVAAIESLHGARCTALRRRHTAWSRLVARVFLRIATLPSVKPWLWNDAEHANAQRRAWEALNRVEKERVRDRRYEAKEERQRLSQAAKEAKRRDKEHQRQERYRARRKARLRALVLGWGAWLWRRLSGHLGRAE